MSLGNTVLQLFRCNYSWCVYCSMCAVPNMAVFCSSLTSWFPGMLLTYFLNDFEMVPVAPVITGITFVFTFHVPCICIVNSLYFRIFSASFLITFLSPEIAASINIHVLFSLLRIIICGLLLGMFPSVWTFWLHSTLTLPPWPVSTDFGTFSYQCFCPVVPLFPYICWSVVMHTLHRVFLCTVLLPVLGMPILFGLLSHQNLGIVCICYLSLCLISSLRNILFVWLGLVLLLFYSHFLLLSFPSKASLLY